MPDAWKGHRGIPRRLSCWGEAGQTGGQPCSASHAHLVGVYGLSRNVETIASEVYARGDAPIDQVLERHRLSKEQKSGSRRGHRNNAEDDPCPGLAIKQPPLKGRGDRRGSDNGPHRKQSLKDWLMGSRIGEKNDRLGPNQQGAAGEALNHSKGDQQVQPSCDGGNAARHADDREPMITLRRWIRFISQGAGGGASAERTLALQPEPAGCSRQRGVECSDDAVPVAKQLQAFREIFWPRCAKIAERHANRAAATCRFLNPGFARAAGSRCVSQCLCADRLPFPSAPLASARAG